jgi:hypothetical protein
MLAAPPATGQHVAHFFSDSSVTGTPVPSVGPPQPVTITIRHDLEGDGRVDVATRRTYGHDLSLVDHMWQSLTETRLAQTDTVPPDQLQEWGHAIAMRQPPSSVQECDLVLDGAPVRWRLIVDDELAVCGGVVGDPPDAALVAVVAQVGLLGRLSVQMSP